MGISFLSRLQDKAKQSKTILAEVGGIRTSMNCNSLVFHQTCRNLPQLAAIVRRAGSEFFQERMARCWSGWVVKDQTDGLLHFCRKLPKKKPIAFRIGAGPRILAMSAADSCVSVAITNLARRSGQNVKKLKNRNAESGRLRTRSGWKRRDHFRALEKAASSC
jgi:hypothetical protein